MDDIFFNNILHFIEQSVTKNNFHFIDLYFIHYLCILKYNQHISLYIYI